MSVKEAEGASGSSVAAVTVTVEEGDFFPVRRSLLRHFPASLLVLEKAEEAAE